MALRRCNACNSPLTEAEAMKSVCPDCGAALAVVEDARNEEQWSPKHSSGTSSCVLCGESNSTRQFYLRTQSSHSTGSSVVTQWINVQANCCQACYQKVLGLQIMRWIVTVMCVVPFIAGTGYLIFVGKNSEYSGIAIIVAILALFTGLLGIGLIGIMRGAMLKSEHFAPMLTLLRVNHTVATSNSKVRIIPIVYLQDL